MSIEGGEDHNTIHSYFIGPKGANLPDFRANINTILDELLEARLNYYPEDDRFISTRVRRSKQFEKIRDNLSHAVRKLAQLLGEHSAPFWSPRYEAHMCTDLTMPSLLGYFMTMLYNPNNVALEASPITTLVELKVGAQLCDLFGYNSDPAKSPAIPLGWGHVTCGGTVANLESIWVARNLKFYPLSLHRAVTVGKLKFLADKFMVQPCQSGAKETLFSKMTTWELLNLRPETVLDLSAKLNTDFGISTKFLQDALNDFNIQNIGREPLEKAFEITDPIQFLIGKTRHYSWPKGAAVAGIGSKSMIGIDVDVDARLDITLLEERLLECAQTKTAVYAVVGIIGSTEEGAVDRLSKIVELRKRFQDEHGLSFLIHADAAWGGYFATMLRRTEDGPAKYQVNGRARNEITNGDTVDSDADDKLVPALCLKKTTEEDLLALQHADSITVDPHKAGYIPYPAGSLVYRDGRMRHLVTWSSPYLSQGSAENIGVYGVEGSKPGAAAMSTWFSNQAIGLNPSGYGMLLGEASFTSGRLSAWFATMNNDFFTCVPFNMLPAEEGGTKAFDSAEVNKQKQWIRQNILKKTNQQIMQSPEAMDMIRRLGSDSNINAFAINWKYEDGTVNADLDEANYFMKRVTDRLSITSANTDPTHIPLYLTSTRFEPDDYGKCASKFMERLGIDACNQGLFVLRNVVMSPFPTQMDFLSKLMGKFEEVVREEVLVSRDRNTSVHNLRFLIQGPRTMTVESEAFLVFQTSFHAACRRQQLILVGKLNKPLVDFYNQIVEDEGSSGAAILTSVNKWNVQEELDQAVKETGKAIMKAKVSRAGYEAEYQTGEVEFTSVVKSRPLNTANQDASYPEDYMPFYLYGTEEQQHISHVLVRSPNIVLCGSNVTFSEALPAAVKELLPQGLILGLSEIPEASQQPFPLENRLLPKKFFFRQGEQLKVDVWADPKGAGAAGPGLLAGVGEKLYSGTMTLEGPVAVDAEEPNKDKWVRISMDSDSWQKELDDIANIMNGSHVEHELEMEAKRA